MWIEITPAHVYFRPTAPNSKGEILWRWQQANMFYGDWNKNNLPGRAWDAWERKGHASMVCVLT